MSSFFELRLFGFSLVKSADVDHARAVSDARRRAYNNLSVILEDRTRDVIEVSKRLDSMVEVNNSAVETIESQVEEILDQRARIDVLTEALKDVDESMDGFYQALNSAYDLVDVQQSEIDRLKGVVSDLHGRLAQSEAALEASQRQALRY